MGNITGLDVVAVRQLGSSLKAQAQALQNGIATINNLVDDLPGKWVGPDAVAFAAWWADQHRPALAAAVQAIDGLSQSALNNADDQERASAGGGAAAAAGAAGAAAAIGGYAGVARIPVAQPVVGMSHREASSWWSGLSAGERAWILDSHPEWIGNLDGVPFSDREAANMKRLDSEWDRLNAQWEEMRGKGDKFGGIFTNDDRRAELIKEKMDAIAGIYSSLSSGEDRHLVLFNADGTTALAAISCGDLDNAKNVAVFTGGVGTDVAGDMTGKVSDMDALRRRAGNGDTATVAWMGYEAPPGTFTDAWNIHKAEVGAVSLASFLSGVKDVNPDAHLTALGHSYGSTTTALALARIPGVVDDAVFFGSPGLAHADIHLEKDHAYLIEAPGDYVADCHRFGGDPSSNPNLTHLSAAGSSGHSEYLKDGSTSQLGMANVISGNTSWLQKEN